tara:strand:- start:575 stop:742 length:168 start_codon:yes stop_codon:yes gene_type:complete
MTKITKISYAKPDDPIFKEKLKTFTPVNRLPHLARILKEKSEKEKLTNLKKKDKK